MSCLGAIAAALLGLGEGTKLRLLKSLELHGWALIGATAICLALPGAFTTSGNSAKASGTLEERKLPMRFNWVECKPDCRGWISAVGIVTADSPHDFEEFARGRDLAGATIVFDSSGGSVKSPTVNAASVYVSVVRSVSPSRSRFGWAMSTTSRPPKLVP